ncbi:MAG: glycoside hydrolase family 13 protein [Ruminococcaceae bacterium]|nr:glycoside hydrolase family 13 protein [Oscillospiraceae bacterium]
MKFCERKYIGNRDLSSFGAFSFEDNVLFKLLIPRRCGASSVCMHLCGEGLENKYYKRFDFDWIAIDGSNDVYTCSIDMSQIGVGLYYYKYEIDSPSCEFYGEGKKVTEITKMENNSDGMIQLLIYQEKSRCASWMHGGIMYHIFVDRFNKSGKCKPKDNVVMNDDWYNGIPQYADVPGGYVENNMFFGGDLYGIIEKLDYIEKLGVTCLYLSPIFDAYSNHKYDTGDYMSVDSMFGSELALEMLINEAKKRSIHIIFDGVFNHTGADSIYFNKNGSYNSVGAYQSEKSPYFEWYNFRKYPDDYECWWDVKILPRVNSNCESYQKFILGDGGVVEKWMKKGIDGFRLDVADELSDDFLKTLNKKVKSINPDGVIYGEVWEDASNKIAYDKRKKYFLGNELDSVMNYPLREAVIDYIKHGNCSMLYDTCKMLYSHYPKHNADLLMNLLGTHDTERILTVLGGESSEGYTNKELSVKRMSAAERKKATGLLKLAYAIIATVPGVPCIYYGDEAGMEGYRDPFNRLPYPWGRENKELLDFYRKIGGIRRSESLFKNGFFEIIECNSDLLAFVRYDDKNFVVTIVNRSDNKYHLDSNIDLKSYETGRAIKVFNPNSAYILKAKIPFENANITFYK